MKCNFLVYYSFVCAVEMDFHVCVQCKLIEIRSFLFPYLCITFTEFQKGTGLKIKRSHYFMQEFISIPRIPTCSTG